MDKTCSRKLWTLLVVCPHRTPSPYMNSLLKDIGNGSMGDGLQSVWTNGVKFGISIGTVLALVFAFTGYELYNIGKRTATFPRVRRYWDEEFQPKALQILSERGKMLNA